MIDAQAGGLVLPTDHESAPEAHHELKVTDVMRVIAVAAAAAVVWLLPADPPVLRAALALPVAVIGGWPILKEALESALHRRMTMELSMTLALAAALLIGEFFVALAITAFVLAAEILEGMTVARGRRAIEDLLVYLPSTVVVRRDRGPVEISTAELRVGDSVLINPGGAIAVDGTVISGHSYVDEATITGESLPVEKSARDTVYAGTLNQTGVLEVQAERIGRDSTFGKIIDAVEHADRTRAPIQRTADRLAGYLVYFALAAALITFVITRDGRATISVIIVAGACGVAAGTPLAILGGVGRAARQGAIIKGGVYLESLAAVDTVVLDKTGTLTYGAAVVQRLVPVAGVTAEALLEAAATAEVRSEHPLGRAILERARGSTLVVVEPDRFESVPGGGVAVWRGTTEILAGSRAFLESRGVSLDPLGTKPGEAGSEVVVAQAARLLGSIVIADSLRAEAITAVQALRGLRVRTVLLTGDNLEATQAIAAQLGVDEFQAGMRPEQKLARVQELMASGHTVAMIGDGVNDAPALSAAQVGVAMGSGTAVTRESADVVLIGNDLARFVDTLRISRRVRRVILQNFVGTIGIDIIGIMLAAFGLLGPLLAAFIHVSSELTFILNSARLLPSRPGSTAAKIGR